MVAVQDPQCSLSADRSNVVQIASASFVFRQYSLLLNGCLVSAFAVHSVCLLKPYCLFCALSGFYSADWALDLSDSPHQMHSSWCAELEPHGAYGASAILSRLAARG